MARPREFDLEEAMTGAMRLFWANGYEESSLADLLEAMNISKGSFYKAFADKNSVYLKALDLYDETVVGPLVADLIDPAQGDGKQRIIRLFESLAATAIANGDRRGCFLCNALVDRAVQDEEVEERLQAMVFRLENGFVRALADMESQQDPESVRAMARGVLASFFGLRVLGRAGLSRSMADDCVSQVRRMLDTAG